MTQDARYKCAMMLFRHNISYKFYEEHNSVLFKIYYTERKIKNGTYIYSYGVRREFLSLDTINEMTLDELENHLLQIKSSL